MVCNISRYELACAIVMASCVYAMLTPVAQAQCDAAGSTTSCSGVSRFSSDFIQQRVDRAITSDPTTAQTDRRLNGSAWDPNANGGLPVLLAPAGNGATINTSISRWGADALNSTARKAEEAKKLANGELKLPKPVSPDSEKVDVWISGKFDELDNNALHKGYASQLGTDYAITPSLLVGAMIEMENNHNEIEDSGSASMLGTSYLVGPYMAARLGKNLTLDTRLAYGQSDDIIGANGIAAEYETERSLAKAQLKGRWQKEKWEFTPTASIAYAREGQVGQESLVGKKMILSAKPEISREINLEDDRVVRPFISYRGNIEVNDPTTVANGSDTVHTNSLGSGFSLDKKDGYSLRATTEIENLLGDGDLNLSSRLELKIPLQ